MKDILWDLFRKTGDIKYFLLIKELEGELNADKEVRGNNYK